MILTTAVMVPAILERPRVLVLRTADQAAVTDAAVMMKLATLVQLTVVIALHLMTVQEAATLEAAMYLHLRQAEATKNQICRKNLMN